MSCLHLSECSISVRTQNNFDILGGMTLDEWLAEKETSGGRHGTIDMKVIETYEKATKKTMSVKTKWAINCFTKWCEETGDNSRPEDHNQTRYE